MDKYAEHNYTDCMELFLKAAPYTVSKHFPAHAHPHWQFIVYHRGKGSISVGGIEIPFKPGRIVCIPPNMMHFETSSGTYSDTLLWMSHCPALALKPAMCDDPSHRPFASMAEVMLREYERGDDGWQGRCSDIADVFIRFFRYYSSGSVLNPYVERIKQKLLEHIADPEYSVEDAAAECGFSAGHSSRLFRKHTGMSPMKFLIDVRIRTAADLLRTESISIGEVARMTGFADRYYFSRIFRRMIGRSPRAYRSGERRTSR